MKKNLWSIPIVVLFFAFLICVDVFAIKQKDIEYSESERRNLTLFPDYSFLENPAGFETQIDKYLRDQFPFRDAIIAKSHELQKDSGNTIVQDTYNLDSDYILPYVPKTYTDVTTALAEAINDKMNEYPDIPFLFTLLPHKNIALADSTEGMDASMNLSNAKRTETIFTEKGIEVYSLYSDFLKKFEPKEREQFYYKTDLHWTEKGAYEASKLLAEKIKELDIAEDIPKTSDFVWMDFSDDKKYMGDLQYRFSDKPYDDEKIPYYEPRDLERLHYFKVIDGDEVPRNEIMAGGLDLDILEYNGLSCYNIGYFRVENDNPYSDKKVAIFKDSYQNPMTDYLSLMFKEINVIDARNQTVDFDKLIEDRDIDLVLCLFHESNTSPEFIDYLVGGNYWTLKFQ